MSKKKLDEKQLNKVTGGKGIPGKFTKVTIKFRFVDDKEELRAATLIRTVLNTYPDIGLFIREEIIKFCDEHGYRQVGNIEGNYEKTDFEQPNQDIVK